MTGQNVKKVIDLFFLVIDANFGLARTTLDRFKDFKLLWLVNLSRLYFISILFISSFAALFLFFRIFQLFVVFDVTIKNKHGSILGLVRFMS
jgi:hypothetical protein